MTISTKPFDAAKYFESTEAQARLLTDALESEHPGYIADALGTVARARGIATIAEETGLSRQALHKALSDKGNPTLSTVLKVLHSLGLQLTAKAREPEMA